MAPGTRKPLDILRLKADLAAAAVDLLSAHCAADRVRLQYSPQDIVAFGERNTIERAIGSAEALHRFFSQVGAHINFAERANRQGTLPPRLGSVGRLLGDE